MGAREGTGEAGLPPLSKHLSQWNGNEITDGRRQFGGRRIQEGPDVTGFVAAPNQGPCLAGSRGESGAGDDNVPPVRRALLHLDMAVSPIRTRAMAVQKLLEGIEVRCKGLAPGGSGFDCQTNTHRLLKGPDSKPGPRESKERETLCCFASSVGVRNRNPGGEIAFLEDPGLGRTAPRDQTYGFEQLFPQFQ